MKKKLYHIHPSEATSILKYFTQEFFAETKIIKRPKKSPFCAISVHREPKKILKKFTKKPKQTKRHHKFVFHQLI